MFRFLILFFCLVILVSCSKISQPLTFFKKELSPATTKEKPLYELFIRAERNFQRGAYDLAYQDFEEIKNKYPGTPEAVLAELRLADIKFWTGDYLEAIPLYEEFEKFYPTNEAIPYVVYQIATCYYLLKSTIDRDPSFAKKAISNYERLLQNYPNSPYTLEAKKRIQELREFLAQHELYVAKFYHKIKYYRGAYNRLLYLMETYPETQAAQVARYLVNSYYQKALKETEELNKGEKKDFFGALVP